MIAPSTIASGGTGSAPNAVTLYPFAGRLQLDSLDRARSDVESDNRFGFCEKRHLSSDVTVELGNWCAVEHAARTRPRFELSCPRALRICRRLQIHARVISQNELLCLVIGRWGDRIM
jgi:hypothetical protein